MMESLKVNKTKNYSLEIIYCLILVALFPVIEFEYYKSTSEPAYASYFTILLRILFTGPVLFFSALTLIFYYKKLIHNFFGFVCLFVGIYWICKVGHEVQ
jgi:hypothetical protein